MKFLCSNCKAKYQIPDEKVQGRTLRMTCRRCREEIVIRGESTSRSGAYNLNPPAPIRSLSPSALAAEFQARVAAPPPSFADAPALDEWHVAINDIPVGPMRREEVARKIAAGAVGPDSLTWREGLDDWLPLAHVPELAALLPGAAPRASTAPPPPPPLQPSQRVEATPLGGRGGAASFAAEEWSHPQQPSDSPSQVAVNPLRDALPGIPGIPRSNNAPMMFAVLGFALLMTVVAIVGARWLQSDSRQVAAASEKSEGDTTAVEHTLELDTVEGDPDESEDEAEEMVIGLDESEASKPKRGAAKSGNAKKSADSKKKLTAEQQAMLERMGASTGSDISSIKRRSGSDSSGGGGGGELTAAQLSRVVLRGKQNLQRCYESAMRRSSGSDETIRMDVSLTVSGSGNVKRVKVAGRGLPGMDTCIERTVKMWRFPGAGGETQTKFPLVFSPGG